jgi:hypothetical protein
MFATLATLHQNSRTFRVACFAVWTLTTALPLFLTAGLVDHTLFGADALDAANTANLLVGCYVSFRAGRFSVEEATRS